MAWDDFFSSPRRRALDLANEENALRVKSLKRADALAEREEENLLRQRGAMPALLNRLNTSGAMVPEGERTIENSLFSDINTPTTELLARAAPQVALERGLEKAFPPGFTGTVGQDQDAYVQGKKVASGPRSVPKVSGPESSLGKLKADLDAGRIDQATYDAAVKKENYITPSKVDDPFAEEAKLRGEFADRTKTFEVVRDSYAKIREVAEKPSPAGDISLIFGYMKMLDPNSTVRESEYATAQNAGSVPERVRALFNKAQTGEGLTPSQRRDFLSQASKIYGSQLKTYKQDEARYGELAKTYGSDPSRVIYDRSGGLTPGVTPIPKVGTVEDGYRFTGSDPANPAHWVKVN